VVPGCAGDRQLENVGYLQIQAIDSKAAVRRAARRGTRDADRRLRLHIIAGDRGPGFTTSAPELASNFGLRPAQFQKSLSNLQSSKMISTVIGSTDGFDNYRLTDYGAAYMKMWERHQAS